MILKTEQGNIDCSLIYDLYNQNKRKWMISISGGCDSAIIAYAVAQTIKQNNWNKEVTLYAMTGDQITKPYNVKFAKKIIDKIDELTGVQFEKHFTSTVNDTDLYETHQLQLMHDSYKEVNWNVFWHGVTANPVGNENVDRLYKTLKNTMDTMGPTDDRNKTKDQSIHTVCEDFDPIVLKGTSDIMFDRITPFINTDKKGVADVYEQYGVTNTLFPVTRSCESDDFEATRNLETHCGQCWFCLERIWGFGKL